VTGAGGGGSVLWELDARGVGTVTLNRPEVNNAYNGDLIQGLHTAAQRSSSLEKVGEAVSCLVATPAMGQSFSAFLPCWIP
jgi:methylglutaconyl-CoA hydratase